MFVGVLTSLVNASNHTKCVLVNNKQMHDSVYSY